MAVFNWPSVTLKGGDAFVIPAACPNCLAPATVQYRYDYTPWLYFITRTRYYQTFTYCTGCEPMMDAWFKWDRWGGCLAILLYPAGIVGGILLGIQAYDLLKDSLPEQIKGPLPFVTTVLGVVLAWTLLRGLKHLLLRKHPLKEGQAIQGPAAYYVGDRLLGGQIYRALRPEWIKLLVEANPAAVDDATYLKLTGSAKPAPAGGKPFAG